MGGEDAVAAHCGARGVQWSSLEQQLPQALDKHESGVPFVGVPRGGIDPQPAQ
jgi:hypothetical protein